MPSSAPDSIWRRALTGAEQLDPTSEAVVANIVADIRDRPGITCTLGIGMAPIYNVPADQPRVKVTLDSEPDSLLAETFAAGVPIPEGAAPTAGNRDQAFAILSLDTDEAWDLFGVANDPVLGWTAKWGGYKSSLSTDPGYYFNGIKGGDGTKEGIQVQRPEWGVCATSFPMWNGVVRQWGLDHGEITHVLGLNVRCARKGVHCWPAQRCDGQNPDQNSPVEGSFFRLDPTLDVDALNLPAPIPLFAHAAQKHGVRVMDQTSKDPNGTTGFTFRCDRITPNWPGHDLAKFFPWERLQLIAMDLRTRPDNTPVPLP